MNLKHLIAGSLLLFGCVTANAATIFTDNFEADTAALNKTTFVGGWTVTNGSVTPAFPVANVACISVEPMRG